MLTIFHTLVVSFTTSLLHPLHFFVVLLSRSDLAPCARKYRCYPCSPSTYRRAIVCDSILVRIQLRTCKLLASANSTRKERARREGSVGVTGEEFRVDSLGLVTRRLAGLLILAQHRCWNKRICAFHDASCGCALLVRKTPQSNLAGLLVELVFGNPRWRMTVQ